MMDIIGKELKIGLIILLVAIVLLSSSLIIMFHKINSTKEMYQQAFQEVFSNIDPNLINLINVNSLIHSTTSLEKIDLSKMINIKLKDGRGIVIGYFDKDNKFHSILK